MLEMQRININVEKSAKNQQQFQWPQHIMLFLCEHWLYPAEDYLIKDRYPNHNLFFQSDMDSTILKKSEGRRFGGKCWLVRKNIDVISFEFDHPDYSIIRVQVGTEILNIIGVWIPYDNMKKLRYCNFKSIISSMENILDDCSDENFLLVGDWNCDRLRGKRFDKLFNNFIMNNQLADCADKFKPSIEFTYKNGDYRATLDHILVRKNDLVSVSKFDVLHDLSNLSDHQPISCEFNIRESSQKNDSSTTKKFHLFDWQNPLFVESFKANLTTNLGELLHMIDQTDIRIENDVTCLIDRIHESLPRIFLK
ncbi:RNA-directed DNA polymerase from mobile element jockey-like [Brachionus plicatilis]|uniref:RNA-directed DNA polymerase from mobile element jockey-like n=1 Tax=Brachionus plicatilis TaxID=10195 RepID=A0A3M7RPP3_BRAPC|nr:RNA-directed DNA polymerase from mobile element jockey-like [Brachionus plicatilis]